MLNERNLAIVAVVVAVLVLGGMLVRAAHPPGGDGTGNDSYGVLPEGHRAVFDTLRELGVPAERGLLTPASAMRKDTRLVFWEPAPTLVAREPAYLERAVAWVKAGGRVVVAPSDAPVYRVFPSRSSNEASEPLSVLAALGLRNVRIDLRWIAPHSPARGGNRKSGPTMRRPFEAFSARSDGSLSGLGALVSAVALPHGTIHVLSGSSKPEPSGRLRYRDADGSWQTLATRYRVGKGEIVVVSEPSLFANDMIARADNAVLAAHLLSQGGRRVVFDEFYHGVSIRGNPFWLLTQRAWGLAAGLVVLAVLVWAWREAVSLGVPLSPRGPVRRSLREYVEAMARLFDRGDTRAFALREIREGVLRELKVRLRLPPAREGIEDVAAALDRRKPGSADELKKAAGGIDALLGRRRRPAEREFTRAAKEMMGCL